MQIVSCKYHSGFSTAAERGDTVVLLMLLLLLMMLVVVFGGETMVSAESPTNDNNDNRNNGSSGRVVVNVRQWRDGKLRMRGRDMAPLRYSDIRQNLSARHAQSVSQTAVTSFVCTFAFKNQSAPKLELGLSSHSSLHSQSSHIRPVPSHPSFGNK